MPAIAGKNTLLDKKYKTESSPEFVHKVPFFKELVESPLFWSRFFTFENYPILNKDLEYLFNGVEMAIKRFKKYTSQQLFDIIISEYYNVNSAMYNMEEIINKNFEFVIDIEKIQDVRIFMDYIDMDDFIIDYDDTKWTFSYVIDIVDENYNKQKSGANLSINKTGNEVIANYFSKEIKIKDNMKFIKNLLIYLFYHRYDFGTIKFI